eukprot:TRINITY_DN195_c0_g1_i2.p1 TRINITY_DN195_c0_g1~~TRINITY_DN195_c0_g1_i2.p1  ORF type:complete len:398 (+),score=51.32 TRINITY_DN195_c0_g1_i2:151-1194(+)
MSNGFPKLSSKNKRKMETCVIDPFFEEEWECNNNPYAGLLRLCFHDCGTSDPTQPTQLEQAGCGAWMSKTCDKSKGEQCEWNNNDNGGLQMWVTPLNDMYNNAKIDNKNINKILSRTDFWQLVCNRAIRKSSQWVGNPKYHAGRTDQKFPEPGPFFPGRLPQASSIDGYKSLCSRNNMAPGDCLALLAAHSLGQAHPKASGYRGSWDSTPTIFDNGFWKGLWKLNWFTEQVDSTDSDGNPQTKLQFSLGGVNRKYSLMLASDIGVLWDITTCPWETDPWALVNKQCKQIDMFQYLVKSWVDSNDKALDDFSDSWEVMSRWGCKNCYQEIGRAVQQECRDRSRMPSSA